MTQFAAKSLEVGANGNWLQRCYFTRAAFSVVWVLLVVTIGRQSMPVAAVLLSA